MYLNAHHSQFHHMLTKMGEKKDGKLVKKVIKEGEGDVPIAGSTAIIHYESYYEDGGVYDSTRFRKSEFFFQLLQNEIIKAIDIGVSTMRKGEICEITAYPEYTYGVLGSPPRIPPNSILKFEIELLRYVLPVEGDGSSVSDKLRSAQSLKELGNTQFSKKSYAKALHQYNASWDLLKNLRNLTVEEEENVIKAKIPILLNIAMSHLKLQHYLQVTTFCNQVLALDSENVKALCRNGEAYIYLHEVELAKQNLSKAHKLNKNDPVIKKLLRVALDLEKKELEKQRQLYSNFFA